MGGRWEKRGIAVFPLTSARGKRGIAVIPSASLGEHYYRLGGYASITTGNNERRPRARRDADSQFPHAHVESQAEAIGLGCGERSTCKKEQESLW